MKNKRGNVFLGVVVGLIIFVFGVLFIPFLADDITTFRADLDCSDTSISDGTKVICLFGDLIIPYLIWFFVSLLFGYLAGSRR